MVVWDCPFKQGKNAQAICLKLIENGGLGLPLLTRRKCLDNMPEAHKESTIIALSRYRQKC